MIEFKVKKPSLVLNSLTNQASATFEIEPYIVKQLDNLASDKTYTIKLSVASGSRTKTQNAYMWELIGQISKKLFISKEQVYKNYVKDYGVYKPIPIKNEAVDDFVLKWEQGGLGWVCEVARDSKLNGYSLVLAYFGSSTYTKEEMKVLIEAIVMDCEEMGIETKPIEEILNMEV